MTDGCFCCRFDNLLDVSARLISKRGVDTILAEADGSCTRTGRGARREPGPVRDPFPSRRPLCREGTRAGARSEQVGQN
ncbi:hypothetical protein, partial [Streptomyces sp. NPDC058622]|uniref:hypothetical protein n=1 Tax=Streptomyces sp. NPDC058622 TaxID=3346562 RepID=UPI00364AA024